MVILYKGLDNPDNVLVVIEKQRSFHKFDDND